MPPPPRRKPAAGDALAAVAPLATRWIERLLAQQDPPLSVPQYLALRAVAREGISGGELARRTGVSGPAVSQLLAGLAEAELIERRIDEADRRRVELQLSPAGKRALSRAESRLAEHLGPLLAELPKPEADALERALPKVEAALSGASPPPRPPPLPPLPPPSKQRSK